MLVRGYPGFVVVGLPQPERICDNLVMHTTESVPLDHAATGLTVNDAAEMLGVSPTTVRAHLRQGTLAGEKVSGSWVVYLAGLPQQTKPLAPIPVESMVASDRAVPSSSRLVKILASLVVLYRRLRGLGTRVPRS